MTCVNNSYIGDMWIAVVWDVNNGYIGDMWITVVWNVWISYYYMTPVIIQANCLIPGHVTSWSYLHLKMLLNSEKCYWLLKHIIYLIRSQ